MIERRLLDSGIKAIAGVDEAGRGACAGPLVVAALILKNPNNSSLLQVRDSKLLTPIQRENLYPLILDQASAHAIIEIPSEEIDTRGLHKSNIEGMRRAVNALGLTPDYVLTDGYEIPGMPYPNLAIWKGDQVALTISAASIIAKVYRDRLMIELDKKYPGYGLAEHKGYVTKAHSDAMKRLGVTPIHRKSYANVAKLIK
ncbi:MAG: ribonuclease HII [Actinobacteria bacterium]|nr:ribonuclease HII [Actinomycetota bacterium]NDH38013.1 ribonuclease HII [Actinomycetota bacterium]